jgi:hypothetical protein
MFAHGFLDVPGAGKALGENDKIILAEFYLLAVFGLDYYFALQKIAFFGGVIIPVKTGDLFFPNRPGLDLHPLDLFRSEFLDFDVHGYSFNTLDPAP